MIISDITHVVTHVKVQGHLPSFAYGNDGFDYSGLKGQYKQYRTITLPSSIKVDVDYSNPNKILKIYQ